ncbi:MAG: transglycosylase domain-containing protein [Myxococcales bacterium]|nr:transglycosylase domain-containing protein [Myxococcales bacterium]
MKGLLWFVLFALGLTGVVTPLVYLYVGSKLPALESEFDLEKLLRFSIEGERMSVALGKYNKSAVDWERPDFAKLPKDLVALYISQRGCPTFFQTERERGLGWAWRLFVGLAGGEPGGDGWCERLLAWRLADRVGAKGDLQHTIGANKIHSFLQKDQLVAYDLASLWLEDGVIGVEAAAQRLFKKRLEQLSLTELAELELALPPHNYYQQVRDCQNPSLLRQHRDVVLAELSRDALVPEDRAKNAQAQPMACTLE